MDEKMQSECKEMIKRYHGYSSESWKVKTRNELYLKMKPWMLKWIKAILYKWGKFVTPNELLSLSWDAFYFCITKHNGSNVHLPKYFYDFTRYFLLIEFAKKENVHIQVEELKDILQVMPTDHNVAMDLLLTFNQCMQSVPEEHQWIFLDAMQSLCPAPKERLWSWKKDCGISRDAYYQLKRSYKGIISWLLGLKS